MLGSHRPLGLPLFCFLLEGVKVSFQKCLLSPPSCPYIQPRAKINKSSSNEIKKKKKKKKSPGESTRSLLRHIIGNTITNRICFLQKSHISWKLHSRRPDGKAWENSELFLLKPFPPEGPEFKREAFAMNNRASVRGCRWRGSKASVGL